jgi:hypothetical protein
MTIDPSQWLLANAGPNIKYRTLTELLHREKDAEPAKEKLLSSPLVNYWLENLKPDLGRNALHGAKTDTYENVMGKLYEFGLRKGTPILDRKTEPFRQWLHEQIDKPNEGYFPVFYRTLIAAFLAMTGYAEEEPVKAWINKRLETIYPFAKKADLTRLYIPQDSYPSFPKAFRNTPFINPEIYPDQQMKLPWIHDLYAFLHSPSITETPTLKTKLETIIRFILTPQYQKLPHGYGTVYHKPRYYAMGWSIHLPGYFKTPVTGREFGRLLLLVELFARSSTAKNHSWYQHSTKTLTQYQTKEGLTSFPRDFLPEMRIGVWVLGMRMGLEETRRTQKAITSESTFRLLKINSQ